MINWLLLTFVSKATYSKNIFMCYKIHFIKVKLLREKLKYQFRQNLLLLRTDIGNWQEDNIRPDLQNVSRSLLGQANGKLW